MALEVLHHQADTHENEQFRRVVKIIDTVFEQHGYEGILIGNPFNENFRRFRADALLLYSRGVVIIDFKDYSGQLIIPREDEFKNYPWYAENKSDHQAVEIKAGAHFLNPFLQLASYRKAFKEIVENNLILSQKIDPTRVCTANIFSGPIELSNKIPGKYRYYKIAQESEIGALLYDLNNDNAFDEDIVKTIKHIFPANEYIKDYSFEKVVINKQNIIIGEDVKSTIDTFMQTTKNDILVLTSMNAGERDNWAKYLFSIADKYKIPEVHGLCHSNRISHRLRMMRGIEASSLYSFIYGGNEYLDNTPENEDSDEAIQSVPIRSESDLDERALLIVYDAHLINRKLFQGDLLRFGTGRLLEDFITFTNPASRRKIVFIGDPYMLSYGFPDESAVNIENLRAICGERVIHHYHQPVYDSQTSCKDSLRYRLAKSIQSQLFNNLNYTFDGNSVIELDEIGVTDKMKEWFSSPFQQEPRNAILFYQRSDCQKTNLLIKKHCLNNGAELSSGDLIIATNNIYIPDDTGFGNPKRIQNGMYFTVTTILEKYHKKIITEKGIEVLLSFTKIAVKCLSLSGQNTEIWVLDNYLTCNDKLAKEEEVAVNIFMRERILEQKKASPFIKSDFYHLLTSDSGYQILSDAEKESIEVIIQNRMVQKENRIKVSTTKIARALLKRYYDKYESNIQRLTRENDPFINTLYAKYAWALTVHKAVGCEFDNVILQGSRGGEVGICNEDYFRWLYSGITAAVDIFYIIQPQYIHPFMKCSVSETTSNVKPSKQLLIFDEYKIPSRFTEIVRLKNIHTSAVICELAKIIEPYGYILERVQPCSEYLTKAIFSIPQNIGQKMIINVHNKGAKENFGVSKIEHNDLIDSNIINQAIETVLSQTSSTLSVYPDYIEDVVNLFINQMKDRGIQIKKVSNKDYQIICKAFSNNGEATLRFWYGTSSDRHNKGFISKIEIFNITDSFITNEVKQSINLLSQQK